MHVAKAKDVEVKLRFGSRLRELRLAAGLSQEELAEASDLDRTYISSTERGQRNISLEAMTQIAAALKVSVAAFFDGSVASQPKKAAGGQA